MNEVESRYYAGCVFLYHVLASLSDANEEILYNTSMSERSELAIYGGPEDLDIWLLDEGLSLGPVQGDFDLQTMAWLRRLESEAAKLGQSVETDVATYYFVINWVLRIVLEFEYLVENSSSDEFRQRYRAVRGLFEEQIAWLQDEILGIERLDVLNERKVEVLRAAVKPIMDQLAAEWLDQVQALAEWAGRWPRRLN